MDIEFKDGAVCFANKLQHFALADFDTVKKFAHTYDDFQLNTIKQGDYIEASELDAKQKYNDVVEVFGLFGFERGVCYEDTIKLRFLKHIKALNSKLIATDCAGKRKLTYPQIMAIGELKRLEIERDKQNQVDMLSMQSIEPRKQEIKMQKNKPVVAQVMIDLTERMEMGIKTYGEALRANNGRYALQDAYEEALDLACYLKQAMIERDNADTN